LERAFARIKRKSAERERRRKKGNTNWNPRVKDRVLFESPNMSDAVTLIIVKFKHVYKGPYVINTVLLHSAYEIVDKGRLGGEFNRRQLKPYRSKTTPTVIKLRTVKVAAADHERIQQA
jgi:hypothetical protein